MYIKCMTSDKSNGWRIMEAHQVQWHTKSRDEWGEPESSEFVFVEWFESDGRCAASADDPFVCVSFYDEKGCAHNVYTELDVFLLNDNGKTIERIN